MATDPTSSSTPVTPNGVGGAASAESHAHAAEKTCCGQGNPHAPVVHEGCGCQHGGHDHDHEAHGCCGHHHDHGHGEAIAALNQRFLHWLGCVALFFIGGVLIYAFTSGRIVHYLTGSGTFRVQCLVAGCGLLVLGAFNLFNRAGAEAGCQECEHGHGHGHEEASAHDHGHGVAHHHHGEETSWVSALVAFLILVVPLGAAVVYSPDRFSDEFMRNKVLAATSSSDGPVGVGGTDFAKLAAQSRESASASSSSAPVNTNAFTVEELERLSGGRTEEGNIKLRLDELYYMPAQTRDVQEVVASQRLETIGQAINDRNDPTKMRIFQMMMSCCAADARPISIPVEFSGPPPTWREMAWYKLVGRVEYREINGATTTVFIADSIKPEKPPRTQLLY